jgi:hypothetical protein
MPRTDSNKVDNILDTSLDSNELTSWIDIATELVDDIEAVDSSLSDKRLEKIERLTAAHLASAQDQRHESTSGASRSVEYQGDHGMGFEATDYGQRALALDPTGTLGQDTEFTLST